jgi:hypothetical protein
MNTVFWLSLGYLVAALALAIFGGPFLIGKPRKPMDALTYLLCFIETAAVAVVAGRALGWW